MTARIATGDSGQMDWSHHYLAAHKALENARALATLEDYSKAIAEAQRAILEAAAMAAALEVKR